ncbi:alpha/beta-hydrolase [Agrocybe pediades]|nr:alpha/beta-hydrolase [Agrocybe pediades]
MDVYAPPLPASAGVVPLPIVIFFHGGALTVGNRESYLPTWLIDRVLSLGYAFISADYRLLIPTTAKEIIEDIQDAFKFVARSELPGKNYIFKLDGDRIAVSGNSAGGLCARLAAIHATPRPKALIDIYGQGGNFFTNFHLDIKPGDIQFLLQTVPHFPDADFKTMTYPFTEGLPPVSTGTDANIDPNLPIAERPVDDPRSNIYPFLFQRGRYLDYYTGLHKPSLTDTLREVLEKKGEITVQDAKAIIPEEIHSWFPQLSIDSKWPPTIMIHGTVDDTVPIEESHHFFKLIKEKSKSPVKFIEVKGEFAVHGWDCFPASETQTKVEFDSIKDFIKEHLERK